MGGMPGNRLPSACARLGVGGLTCHSGGRTSGLQCPTIDATAHMTWLPRATRSQRLEPPVHPLTSLVPRSTIVT
eukprot:8218881-Prorocentrum_lima.AAC.1